MKESEWSEYLQVIICVRGSYVNSEAPTQAQARILYIITMMSLQRHPVNTGYCRHRDEPSMIKDKRHAACKFDKSNKLCN